MCIPTIISFFVFAESGLPQNLQPSSLILETVFHPTAFMSITLPPKSEATANFALCVLAMKKC